MRKSNIYRLAQRAVLRDDRLPEEVKLEILRELQSAEATALFTEEREDEVNAKAALDREKLEDALAEITAHVRSGEDI